MECPATKKAQEMALIPMNQLPEKYKSTVVGHTDPNMNFIKFR